jgi:hypothetical protein
MDFYMFDSIENNINWLAQCKRRIYYPIDHSERVGLSAFEYGWKSFNNIYDEFKSGSAKNRMYECLDRYLDSDEFFKNHQHDLEKFCTIDHRIYVQDENYNSLNPKLSSQVEELQKSILACNHIETPKKLIDCLYTIRNARIHGSFGTGKVYFSYLPKSIFSLNIYILSTKLNISKIQLLKEIERKTKEIKSNITRKPSEVKV